jgi:hypothetical protein
MYTLVSTINRVRKFRKKNEPKVLTPIQNELKYDYIPLDVQIRTTEETTIDLLNTAFPEIEDIRACLFCRLNLIDNAPRCCGDFNIKFRNFDRTKNNYFQNGEIILTEYKTARSHGIYQMTNLTSETKDLLGYLTFNNTADFLFHDRRTEGDSSFMSDMASKFFTIMFGKRTIHTDIRKTFVSTMKAQGKLDNEEDVARYAIQMGHTVTTQYRDYTFALPDANSIASSSNAPKRAITVENTESTKKKRTKKVHVNVERANEVVKSFMDSQTDTKWKVCKWKKLYEFIQADQEKWNGLDYSKFEALKVAFHRFKKNGVELPQSLAEFYNI